MQRQKQPKFSPGQIVITTNALHALSNEDVQTALARHLQGDWGDCDPEDAEENELSLKEEFRLFSVYHTTEENRKFWIITEQDRSATTVLLPEDY